MNETINEKFPGPLVLIRSLRRFGSKSKLWRLTEFGRLFRFGITGVTATLIYGAVTILLVEECGMGAVVAAIIGYLASSGVSYFGHLYFSFAVRSDHRAYLWRFAILSAMSFVLNVAITWIATHGFGYSARVSVIVVSIVIPTTNYVCIRFWVFLPGLRQVEKDPAAAPFVAENARDSF